MELTKDKTILLNLTDSNIIIGDDTKTDDFYATVKMEKWNKESFLTMEYLGIKGTPLSNDLLIDKATIESVNEDVRIYQKDDNSLEFEIVLKTVPVKNQWVFQLTGYENFTFTKQPDESGDDSVYQPENVINSYAVYHKTFRNNIYKSGKFCHIYRPKFIDSKNNEIWADIDIIDGIMAITGDSTWLAKANYPVILDPDLGYSTQGLSYAAVGVDGTKLFGNRYTATAGDLDNAKGYTWTNGGNPAETKMGLYDIDGSNEPQNLVSGSDVEFTNAGAPVLNTIAVTGSITAQDYYILLNVNQYYNDRPTYDTVADTTYAVSAADFTYGGSMPASAASTWTINTGSQRRYSFWYEYTETGGGGWTGTINGVTNPSKINGIAVANITSINGVS